MLSLSKETLTELTADDLASVAGGLTCFAASCITGGVPVIQFHTTFTQTIIQTEVSGSC